MPLANGHPWERNVPVKAEDPGEHTEVREGWVWGPEVREGWVWGPEVREGWVWGPEDTHMHIHLLVAM